MLLIAAFASLGGWRAANSADIDVTPFIGTWISKGTTEVVTTCDGAPIRDSLTGNTLAIGPGITSDLVLDIGCHCRLPLAISPTEPQTATLTAPTSCELAFSEFAFAGTVDAMTIRLDPTTNTLAADIHAGMTHAPPIGDCESTTITSTLNLDSATVAECGPDSSAVAVLPAANYGIMGCPLGAGREGLKITIANESSRRCLTVGGLLGEGYWGLPQARKHDPACRPRLPEDPLPLTYLSLCRVDGRRFKPLTTDSTAVEQFYAVLKMSDDDQPCPNGSVEMRRRIDSEDDDNMSRVVGRLGPNKVGNQEGNTSTELHFCFFRWAENEADTMGSFPDLGFPYAIFHDHEGTQPLWVTVKAWIYSDDENSTNGNDLTSMAPDAAALTQFQTIIESPLNATMFELARVR